MNKRVKRGNVGNGVGVWVLSVVLGFFGVGVDDLVSLLVCAHRAEGE
jgi:hypothetical protein